MLLPALEETTPEETDQAMQLLRDLKERSISSRTISSSGNVEPPGAFFWQSFFLCAISISTRAIGILTWMTLELPRFGSSTASRIHVGSNRPVSEPLDASMIDVKAIMYPEPGLLMRCFVVGLSHDQILVQRGFLELLVTHLPLNAKLLQQIAVRPDVDLLMMAAVKVTLRRDASLNRRLWSWLLGSEPSAPIQTPKLTTTESSSSHIQPSPGTPQSIQESNYFELHGAGSLMRVIIQMTAENHGDETQIMCALRMCCALMDESTVSGVVLPTLIIPLMRCTRSTLASVSEASVYQELTRTCRKLIDNVDPGLIWQVFFRLSTPSLLSGPNKPLADLQNLRLVVWMLTQVDATEPGVVESHLPALLLNNLKILQQSLQARDTRESQSNTTPGDALLTARLEVVRMLCLFLTENSPAFSHTPKPPQNYVSLSDLQHRDDELSVMPASDGANQHINRSSLSPEGSDFAGSTMNSISSILIALCEQEAPEGLLKSAADIYTQLLRVLHPSDPAPVQQVLRLLEQAIISREGAIAVTLLFAGYTIMLSIITEYPEVAETVQSLVSVLASTIFALVGPEMPQHHVELVRCLWNMQQNLPSDNRVINEALADALMQGKGADEFTLSSSSGTRFATIWTHLGSLSAGEEASTIEPSKVDPLLSSNGTSNAGLFCSILSKSTMVVLHSLDKDAPDPSSFARDWLQNLTRPER